MEITQVDVEEIANIVGSGAFIRHPAPFEGLFSDRLAAYEAYAAGLRGYSISPDALVCRETGEIKSMVVWLDPAPEAEALDVAAVRIIGLFSTGFEEDRTFELVKVLDTLKTRLRQREREYLLIDVNPGDNPVVRVLGGSNFSLVNAGDVLVAEGQSVGSGLSLEKAEEGDEFEDFVSAAVPSAVDPYLGDFAVRAMYREFLSAAEHGNAHFVLQNGKRIGVITIESPSWFPNDTLHVMLVYPWDNFRLYLAALTAGAERVVIRAPLEELKLRGKLADCGFRPCDARMTYRLLL
jgi:hypothetical protein